jgi:hypothetical protein
MLSVSVTRELRLIKMAGPLRCREASNDAVMRLWTIDTAVAPQPILYPAVAESAAKIRFFITVNQGMMTRLRIRQSLSRRSSRWCVGECEAPAEPFTRWERATSADAAPDAICRFSTVRDTIAFQTRTS